MTIFQANMANGFANGEYPNMPGWPPGYPPLGAGSMVSVQMKIIYFYRIISYIARAKRVLIKLKVT